MKPSTLEKAVLLLQKTEIFQSADTETLKENIAADAEFFENFPGRGGRSFIDESEEEVFGGNILVLQPLGFVLGLYQEFAQTL